MPAATPYISRRPQVTIGGADLDCHMRKASLLPEDDEVDIATFCNPKGRAPGGTAWTLEIDVLQSFGDGVTLDGLYDQLAPLAKTRVAFTLEMDKTVGPTVEHPHFTGFVYVPSIPILDATISEKSEFTLTFFVDGEPTEVTA
jgi:hypothetical protein